MQKPGPEAPQYSVQPATIGNPCYDIKGADAYIIIANFGEAFFPEERPAKKLHTPTLLLPPEYIFGEHPNSAADVWTLGCTLFNLLGARRLFEGIMSDADDTIAEMISTLGTPPQRWWKRLRVHVFP